MFSEPDRFDLRCTVPYSFCEIITYFTFASWHKSCGEDRASVRKTNRLHHHRLGKTLSHKKSSDYNKHIKREDNDEDVSQGCNWFAAHNEASQHVLYYCTYYSVSFTCTVHVPVSLFPMFVRYWSFIFNICSIMFTLHSNSLVNIHIA